MNNHGNKKQEKRNRGYNTQNLKRIQFSELSGICAHPLICIDYRLIVIFVHIPPICIDYLLVIVQEESDISFQIVLYHLDQRLTESLTNKPIFSLD